MKNTLIIILFSLVLFSCKKEIELIVEVFPIEKTENWMQDLIQEFPSKDITLKDICLPRAHDAGMYEVNNCFAGNACNTQTQELSMKNMLESGVRVFDVRPTFHDGEFWTYHKTQCGGFGCDGVKLGELLDDTKKYLETHNELVILEISKFCEISDDDVAFLNLVNSKLGNLIYKESALPISDFINKPLSEILDESAVSGKVILQMNAVTENKSLGYFDNGYILVDGSYANEYIFAEMKSDQLEKLSAYNSEDNSLFKLSWTVTLNNELGAYCFEENPTSIKDLTLEVRNELRNTLDEWIARGIIYKGKTPNYISVDFANTSVTEQCIRLSRLNLE